MAGMQYAILYGSITDRELVRMLHDARMRSPIIDELCRRVENNPDPYDEAPEVHQLKCPICRADLVFDEEEGKLT